jgi:hypothetical protein
VISPPNPGAEEVLIISAHRSDKRLLVKTDRQLFKVIQSYWRIARRRFNTSRCNKCQANLAKTRSRRKSKTETIRIAIDDARQCGFSTADRSANSALPASPPPATSVPQTNRPMASQPVEMHAKPISSAPTTNTTSEQIDNLNVQGINGLAHHGELLRAWQA